MTTLAQKFIEFDANKLAYQGARHYHQDVIDRLTLSITSAKEYDRHADRVVFEEPLNEIMLEMIREKQIDLNMIYKHVRLPCENIWMEWRDVHKGNHRESFDKMGVLLCPSSDTDLPLRMSIVVTSHDKLLNIDATSILAVYDMALPPYANGDIQAKIQWSIDGREMTKVNVDTWTMTLNLVMKSVLFGLFLLQQPKVIEHCDVKHPPKLQQKRRKHGKLDLLEYRRVKMRFGVLGSRVGVITGQSGGGNGNHYHGGGKKRYHLVLGHFRCYHRDTSSEHVIWIEPHYRGDPTKGMLIRERVLTMQKVAT